MWVWLDCLKVPRKWKSSFQLLYNHMYRTFYRTQLLINDDLEVCSMQELFKSFSVDSAVNQIVFVARGSELIFFLCFYWSELFQQISNWSSMDLTQFKQLCSILEMTSISGQTLMCIVLAFNEHSTYPFRTANGVVTGNYIFNFLSSDALSSCAYRIYQQSYHAATPSV